MYGGTKAELERLIADAASYTEVQREMGVTVDASSMSFDNIVNAIAVVQGKLGIAGATSLEAATTIEGSFNSMKAAWENLITGMSDPSADFGGLVGQLVDTASTFAENLLPVVEKAVTGSAELVGTLAPQILEKIPELLSMLLPKAVEVLSTIVSTVVSILPNILTLLTGDAIPMLLSAVETIFNELVSALPNLVGLASGALSTLLPLLINTALSLVMALLDNIDSIIAPLAEALPDILINVLGTVTDNLPKIITSLINAVVELLPTLTSLLIDVLIKVIPEILWGLLEGAVMSIPAILKGVGALIWEIIKALPKLLLAYFTLMAGGPFGAIILVAVNKLLGGGSGSGLSGIFDTILNFLTNIWQGIVDFFTEKVPEFLSQFFDWMKELPEKIAYYVGFAIGFFQSLPLKIFLALLQIIVKFLEWRQSLIDKVKEQLPIVIENIVEFFKELPDKIRDWLGEVITKFISWTADFVEDVKETVPDIIDKIVSFFEDLPETIKEVGGNIISGLWEGIQSGVETLKTNVKTVCDTVIQGFKDGWQIKSPSRRAKVELAKNVILGISGGFKDFSGLAVKAMEDVSDEIYDAFDNGYDIEYAVDTASTPYEGETLTQSLANAMNALISVEDNKKIDVEISIDGSNTEVGRMLLNLINVTAKEVYA